MTGHASSKNLLSRVSPKQRCDPSSHGFSQFWSTAARGVWSLRPEVSSSRRCWVCCRWRFRSRRGREILWQSQERERL